jgi:hypothetical protein
MSDAATTVPTACASQRPSDPDTRVRPVAAGEFTVDRQIMGHGGGGDEASTTLGRPCVERRPRSPRSCGRPGRRSDVRSTWARIGGYAGGGVSGYTRQEVAQRAGVDPDYLDHLVELGITAVVRWGSHDGRWPFQARDGAGQRAELALFAAAGVWGWAGLLAAGFSQLLGFPALPVLAFAYLFGMSRLRG